MANIISFSSVGLGRTQKEILLGLEKRLNEIRYCKPDLVCFPEEILISGGDHSDDWEANNAAALTLCREYAKKLHTNLEICLEEKSEVYPDRRYNTAYLLDRDGNIVTKYRKQYITFRSLQKCLPGSRGTVATLDIGRVGILTCFDIGWRECWKEMEDLDARLVIWDSAYHGGNLINAYAAVHRYYIVTSPWRSAARIVSPLGNTIAEGSQWDAFVSADIDLSAELFHFDHNEQKLPAIRAALGNKVGFEVEPNGNIFLMRSLDPEYPLSRIKREFDMETYEEYHRRSQEENMSVLEKYPDTIGGIS